MESKAISKHLKFIKYFSAVYSSTSLIAAADATKAFQLQLKGKVAYANLTGKKDPVIVISGVVQNMNVCVTYFHSYC